MIVFSAAVLFGALWNAAPCCAHLCDALHALWNVDDEGDLLIEYCEIEGYGREAHSGNRG